MFARAFVAVLASEGWAGPEQLEITSIPQEYVEGFTPEDIAGFLGLEIQEQTYFDNLAEVRSVIETHFAAHQTALGSMVSEAFDESLVVIQQSPGETTPLAAVAGAGVLITGAATFGPWVIVALPVGLFLMAAAPKVGDGFGEWVRSWFRRKAREQDR